MKKKTEIKLPKGIFIAKKILLICAFLLIALGAVACEKENDYLNPIENYYNTMIDFNKDNLEKCVPQKVWEYIEHEYGLTIFDLRKSLDNSSDEYITDLEKKYGNGITIQPEITGVEELDDESYEYEIKSLKECGIHEKDIQEMKRVTYKIRITGSNKTEDKPKWDDIVKIKGKWYLCDIISETQREAEYFD